MHYGFSLPTEVTEVCTLAVQWGAYSRNRKPVELPRSSTEHVWSCRFYYIHFRNYPSQIKSSETLNEAIVLLTYFPHIYIEQVGFRAL